jgi:hypothetical protein
MIQTNTGAALFEGVPCQRVRPFALEEPPRNRRLALLACVPAYQLGLCNDMTFHPGIHHLAPLCATAQIQFAIKSEDLERIPMRARGRTWTFVIGLAKIISRTRLLAHCLREVVCSGIFQISQ